MIPELLRLGAALANELQQTSLRVVVVISADGAHTHLKVQSVQPCASTSIATFLCQQLSDRGYIAALGIYATIAQHSDMIHTYSDLHCVAVGSIQE